jgi:hypothetical protein
MSSKNQLFGGLFNKSATIREQAKEIESLNNVIKIKNDVIRSMNTDIQRLRIKENEIHNSNFAPEVRGKDQKATVLKHLQKHKSITGKEAWDGYGVYRLSSVINRLRRSGHSIRTEMIKGDGYTYGKYHYETK